MGGLVRTHGISRREREGDREKEEGRGRQMSTTWRIAMDDEAAITKLHVHCRHRALHPAKSRELTARPVNGGQDADGERWWQVRGRSGSLRGMRWQLVWGDANLQQTGGHCLMIGIKAHQQEPPSIHLVAKRVGSIYSLPDHTTPICLPGNHVALLAILLPDRCPASLGLRETSVFKCLPPDSPSNLRRSTVLLRSLKCSTNGILPLVILNSWHNNLVLNDQFCCLVTFEPMHPRGGGGGGAL